MCASARHTCFSQVGARTQSGLEVNHYTWPTNDQMTTSKQVSSTQCSLHFLISKQKAANRVSMVPRVSMMPTLNVWNTDCPTCHSGTYSAMAQTTSSTVAPGECHAITAPGLKKCSTCMGIGHRKNINKLPTERDKHQLSKRPLALQTQSFIGTMGINRLPGVVTQVARGIRKANAEISSSTCGTPGVQPAPKDRQEISYKHMIYKSNLF